MVRPTAEGLLPEVYARLSRHGQPALPRLWDALSARFAQEWTAYCRARGVDEMPEWEDFPLTRAADLTRLLQDLLVPPDGARGRRPGREARPPGCRRRRPIGPAQPHPPPIRGRRGPTPVPGSQ
ncbi:MAG: hypothetical protein NVSMB65_16980 [Chloroflexota bacterium]